MVVCKLLGNQLNLIFSYIIVSLEILRLNLLNNIVNKLHTFILSCKLINKRI